MENETNPTVASTAALAKYLGLSRWTVSRVLNEHPGVRAETRERVMEAIRELGFEPNRLARSLRGAPSRLVGVCFQELEAPILARKTSLLQKSLREYNYRGILELTSGDQNLEATIIRHFMSIRVDGIVLVGSRLDPQDGLVEQLRFGGIPVVAVDPVQPLPFPEIRLNREAAMKLKLNHLYELGHRSFGLLGLESDDLYGEQRMSGLRVAARKLGLDPKQSFHSIALPGYALQDFSYGTALAEALLKLTKPLPTALIALNDRLAIAISRHLQESGYRVPEDFSIVGFDNLDISSWVRPDLTTIDQNVVSMMAMASEVLIGAINEGSLPVAKTYEVLPSLVVRGSTGRCPQL